MTAHSKCQTCGEWVEAMSFKRHVCHTCSPQLKPLSDEEIENIAGSCCHGATAWHNPELDIHEFARAIEERHGIK